jgi:hypothetical protein
MIITKELVSRDTKSTILSAVTCASSWVGEKQASKVSVLERPGRTKKDTKSKQQEEDRQVRRRSSETEDRTKKETKSK